MVSRQDATNGNLAGQSFSDSIVPGSHVFFGAPRVLEPQETDQLRQSLQTTIGDGCAILWADGPHRGGAMCHAVHAIRFDQSRRVVEDAKIPIGDLELWIVAGSSIELSPVGVTIRSDGPGDRAITFGPPDEANQFDLLKSAA